ncbi:MAG: NAD-dependent epimerase/dehydratase family protein [Bacteroidetes bacterium]|nr:NAD-dependent epimerase/dehydratase family protein [Bacteroidota bacterium]
MFVTGGTGFLGSYLLRYLVKKGYHNILALKRSSSSMALVEEVADKVEWVNGDILNVADLEEAMHNRDVVFHCAALVSFSPADTEALMQINVDGTANIVNTALHLNVKKFIHASSIAAIGRVKDDPHINENTEWQRSKLNTKYAISKYLSEQEVWRGAAEGLDVAIVNPSIILGSGFWDRGPSEIFTKIWNGFPFYPSGTTGFVDVRDVVRLMVLLLEKDISHKRFIVNGENLSYHKLFSEMAMALNKNTPHIKVNPFIREIAWRLSWLQSKITRKHPLITKETAHNSSKTFYYDNAKSVKELKFKYTPIRKTIMDTCKQLKEASEEEFKPKFLFFD